MYNELYAAWQREIDDPALGALQLDFYAKIAEYLQHIKTEDKVLDKKTVKMSLLEHEALNKNENGLSRGINSLVQDHTKGITQ
jgi:hypothetical protein